MFLVFMHICSHTLWKGSSFLISKATESENKELDRGLRDDRLNDRSLIVVKISWGYLISTPYLYKKRKKEKKKKKTKEQEVN